MGIMNCKVHGRTGFVQTCAHVRQDIDSGRIPTGHKRTFQSAMFVCQDCFDSPAFQQFARLAELPRKETVDVTDEELEAWEAACEVVRGGRCICAHCFEALLES